MSAQPPSQPQISADGKFYWDGQRWVPMQQPAPMQQAAPQSHRGRNFAVACVGLIVVVVVIAVIAVIANGGTSGGTNSQSAPKWDVSGRSTTSSTVGGADATQVTVTNNGPAASNLILYLSAKDDWFNHHVIIDPGGCTINKNLERLECGSLDAGATKMINVVGSPTDAGNFDFELEVADEEGSQLLYPDKGALTWSEAVISSSP